MNTDHQRIDSVMDSITKVLETLEETKQDLNALQMMCTANANQTEKTNKSLEANGDFHKLVLQESRSIIDQIAAESSIIRDLVLKKKTKRQNYVLDFHVMNFSLWVGCGAAQYSRLWCLDHVNAHLKAQALFTSNGKLYVRLVQGRIPRVMGLMTVGEVNLKVKARGVNLQGGEDWVLKEIGGHDFDEEIIEDWSDGWSYSSDVISYFAPSCQDVFRMNLVDDGSDKLLIRFEISLI